MGFRSVVARDETTGNLVVAVPDAQAGSAA